jgi:hypothetical protein
MSLILGILDSGGAAAGVPGTYESIATVTVGSGGSSSISFTSIPNTYTHLQIRAIARDNRSATDTVFYMQFNGDTGANYAGHDLYGNGTSAIASVNAPSETVIVVSRFTGSSATSANFGAIVMDILDYGSTNKNKTVRILGGFDNNGSGRIYLSSGLWMNSGSAISSISFTPVTTPIQQYSQFALYGIKGA